MQLQPLREWVKSGKPMWGTCAGMIMLAERATGMKEGGQALLGGLNVEVHRNFFGSQLASFEAPLELAEDAAVKEAVLNTTDGKPGKAFVGIFIRAPAILSVGANVTPVAWVSRPRRDAQVPVLPSSAHAADADAEQRVIVAVTQGPFLATAFHPELVESPGFHRLFVRLVESQTNKKLLPTS